MPKRDPEKTARNKRAAAYSEQLRTLFPAVQNETGVTDLLSWHGKIGGKYADYIDIKNEVIYSEEQFAALYLEGFKRKFLEIEAAGEITRNEFVTFNLLRHSPSAKEYLYIFLKRTYLRYYESLSKKRPLVEEAEIWIGQNKADYGLLVTPRFRNGQWENDKSEIRRFPKMYWSIGHIMTTGLVIPGRDERIQFHDIDQCLTFLRNVLVRQTGSVHQLDIYDKYVAYVKRQENPETIPLLIPEFRYGGREIHHDYRLDFTIIDPIELDRYGFEFSPWSTHGYIRNTKKMSAAEINAIAKSNFEDEMKKHKDFFRRHDVHIQIYTDSDLADKDRLFSEILAYIRPQQRSIQLKLHILDDIFS